jgi:hypothetical protein
VHSLPLFLSRYYANHKLVKGLDFARIVAGRNYRIEPRGRAACKCASHSEAVTLTVFVVFAQVYFGELDRSPSGVAAQITERAFVLCEETPAFPDRSWEPLPHARCLPR